MKWFFGPHARRRPQSLCMWPAGDLENWVVYFQEDTVESGHRANTQRRVTARHAAMYSLLYKDWPAVRR